MISWIKNKIMAFVAVNRLRQKHLLDYEDLTLYIMQMTDNEARILFDQYAARKEFFDVVHNLDAPDRSNASFPPSLVSLFTKYKSVRVIELNAIIAPQTVNVLSPSILLLCYESDGSNVLMTSAHDGVYISDDIILNDDPPYRTVYHWLLATGVSA